MYKIQYARIKLSNLISKLKFINTNQMSIHLFPVMHLYALHSDISCVVVVLKVVSVYWWVTHAALLIYIFFSVTEMLAFSCCLCLLVKLLIVL